MQSLIRRILGVGLSITRSWSSHLKTRLRWYIRPKVLLAWGALNAFGFFISQSNFAPFYLMGVVGTSMEPALKPGQLLLVCRWCQPHRGDLVVINNAPTINAITQRVWSRFGSSPESIDTFIKRVAATPHQDVPPYSIDDWRKYQLPVSLQVVQSQLAKNPGIVPDRTLWLLGDNLANSVDSRFWGPVHLRLVNGVVLFVLPNFRPLIT